MTALGQEQQQSPINSGVRSNSGNHSHGVVRNNNSGGSSSIRAPPPTPPATPLSSQVGVRRPSSSGNNNIISPPPHHLNRIRPSPTTRVRSASFHVATPGSKAYYAMNSMPLNSSITARPFSSPIQPLDLPDLVGGSPLPVNKKYSTVPFIPNIHSSGNDPTVEAAIESERSRIKEREEEESTFDEISQFKIALKRERAHSLKLATELASFKSKSVKSQAEAEAHEEGIINGLLRRLECLQKEKGRIIVELEREEEMLTNTLQKKLNDMRREKALLERQIERESSANIQLRNQLGSNSSSGLSL